MSDSAANRDRLLDLMDAVCEENASEFEKAELNQILLTDAGSRSRYLNFCWLHTALEVDTQAQKALDASRRSHFDTVALAPWESETLAALTSPGRPLAPGPAIPVIPSFPEASSYFSSGWPIAYLVATVIFAIGLAVGAIVHVSTPAHIVAPSSPLPSPSSPCDSAVARITGMVDCVWEETGDRVQGSGAADHQSEIINHKSVLHLGDRLALRSGLLELTYDTGARVILQGPVTYEVESAAGGYLAVGKLTATLEKKSEVSGQRPEPANQKLSIRNHKSFAVRTPTALVTDLGTEFGVEVNKQGATTSRVFRGSIEVQLAAGDGATRGETRVLHENESVRVSVGEDKKSRFTAASAASAAFVRKLPGRVPLRLFGTGVGLKEGQPDPHWKIVATNRDRAFAPRPALVAQSLDNLWMPNVPKRSQWISTKSDVSSMFNEVASCTFRTQFDLVGVRPDTTRLRGRFIADNRIRAIRLNGRNVSVPEYDRAPFHIFRSINITGGFRRGTNVLDIDVDNPGPELTAGISPAAGAAGVVTLFRDDFEAAAASTAPYPDNSGDYSPGIGTLGNWTVHKNAGKNVQVIASTTPPDPAAGQGRKCLRLRREISGIDVAAAAGTFAVPTPFGTHLRITQRIYAPPTEQNTEAIVQITVGDAVNLIGNYGGHNNGSVVSYTSSNEMSHDTGVKFIAGKWQTWQIDYNVGSGACTLTIDGRSASAIPVNIVDDVDNVKFHANPGAGAPTYVDDVSVVAAGGPIGLRVELEGSALQESQDKEGNAP